MGDQAGCLTTLLTLMHEISKTIDLDCCYTSPLRLSHYSPQVYVLLPSYEERLLRQISPHCFRSPMHSLFLIPFFFLLLTQCEVSYRHCSPYRLQAQSPWKPGKEYEVSRLVQKQRHL